MKTCTLCAQESKAHLPPKNHSVNIGSVSAHQRGKMTSILINRFPKPLLQDLLEGRWLPIVGAGFSLNASVPEGSKMPLWDDLGRNFANEMEDYPYTGPVDAISAFAHEFSRAKLIEKLREFLFIGTTRPGKAHLSFARLQFDIVCTTNFDFLLEQAYQLEQRYCQPILDEDQLAVASQDSSVRLLKLHGDIHHPQRMVVTEDDYDLFLEHYPLIATYLASMMITRTPVFIGYSLDDPDFRMVWQIVSERLGRLRRQAYVVVVDGRQPELARYDRRGVKPVNLGGTRSQYEAILAQAFDELGEYVRKNILPISKVTEEEPLQELSLPQDAPTRICFFAIPFTLQSFYRDKVFPLAKRHGLVPMTAEDVVSPGETIAPKIEALISRSAAMVVDASSASTKYELRLAFQKLDMARILMVSEKEMDLPYSIKVPQLVRTKRVITEPEPFLTEIDKWLTSVSEQLTPTLIVEPNRLLNHKEFRSAVISAFTLLETSLRRAFLAEEAPDTRFAPLSGMLSFAVKREIITKEEMDQIRNWSKIRNSVVHTDETISAATAKNVVSGIMEVVQKIRSNEPIAPYSPQLEQF
jgi:hypothetical protein